MKQVLKRFLGGYLKLRLVGFSPERFLNLCMANQIIIWDLRYIEDSYQFYMTVKDYRRVKALVKKARVRLRITGRYGLPFFLHRNRKRKLYAAGIAAFFLILFVMSNFIWNITLEGNYRFTDDMLLHYLDSMGIRYGVSKSVIDCDALEESIRSSYPEIIWVSARVSGTRLLIRIKENDVVGSLPEKDGTPRNLVANKAGVITSIVVRKGKAQVKVGDAVEEGQILVSGEIPIYNDAEELVNSQYVYADADVFAQTELSYEERIPHFVLERSYTGNRRRGFRLRFGELSFLCIFPSRQELMWEFKTTSSQAAILHDFYLPVWIDKIEAREYEIYERKRTEDEVNAIGDQIQQQKIQNLMEKGVEIIENDVKILDMDSCWKLNGHFVLVEPVGTGATIDQAQENGQADERN